jgi:hypothetical protein
VPDNGAECPCNPYKRGRGHKGSDALLEAVKKRHERSGRPRIAPVEMPRKLRPACASEASDQ